MQINPYYIIIYLYLGCLFLLQAFKSSITVDQEKIFVEFTWGQSTSHWRKTVAEF